MTSLGADNDRWSIHSGLGNFRFMRRSSLLPEERPRVVTEFKARAAIEDGRYSGWNLAMFEQIYRALRSRSNDPFRAVPRGRELVDRLLEGVRAGELVAIEAPISRPPLVREEKASIAERPPPKPVKVTASIELKFVYDQSDKGVGSLEFKVRTADGKEQKVKTDGKGMLRLRGIEPGSVVVWTDVADARLETTVVQRAIGETPSPEATSDHEPKKPAKHLLRVDALHVHDGETFKTVAEDCDIPWQTLALFNFGTDDEEQLAKQVPKVVGAEKAASLDEIVFDESDDPGIIYLPRGWKASFHTSQAPVFRVVGIKLPSSSFRYSH